MVEGGRDSLEQNRFGSCSSRVDANAVTYDADVDNLDIEEEHHPNYSGSAIIDSDDADDAGIFSIINDNASEREDTLADEESNLLAVRTRRTERQNNESAENFLLTREAVVRFVQDSIANAVDRQKRNADKNGRANVLSFNVNDLVLLSTVNLPGHAVTSVGSSKLLPKYIGPFRVLHRKGNAYTIELPRKMQTHPTFYVGRLRPYCQYELSTSDEDSPHVQEHPSSSCVRAPYDPYGRAGMIPRNSTERSLRELSPARRKGSEPPARPKAEQWRNRRDLSPDQPRDPCGSSARCQLKRSVGHARASSHRAIHRLRDPSRKCRDGKQNHLEEVFPPPPHPLVYSHGGQRFLVERILNHRDDSGSRTRYLVQWRGYPPSWNSWEPRSQLLLDVEGLVRQYDETHPIGPRAHR